MSEAETGAPAVEPAAEVPESFDWAIVEIMGHRRHAGRIREEERFGAKMLRIDVPKTNAEGTAALTWTTHFYGGSSIFSLTYSDELTVLRANKPSSWDQPRRLSAPAIDDEDEDERDEAVRFAEESEQLFP